MKEILRLLCVGLAVISIVQIAPAVADDNHDKWIDVLSIDWGSHVPGASTSMGDGKYKDRSGRFVVVQNGKVAARGLDFKKYEDAATTPARARPQNPRGVAPPDDGETRGLLLPAVQKVRDAAAKSESSSASPQVAPRPQKGIEPDEIDVQTRVQQPAGNMTGQSRRRGAAVVEDMQPKPARAGQQKMSVQQMMAKLRPGNDLVLRKRPGRASASPTTTGGATSVQAPAAPPSKYEIADCGTAASPMICCHHEAGDGSSCNLFQMLCENAGGTAQGDGESATCSDWP